MFSLELDLPSTLSCCLVLMLTWGLHSTLSSANKSLKWKHCRLKLKYLGVRKCLVHQAFLPVTCKNNCTSKIYETIVHNKFWWYFSLYTDYVLLLFLTNPTVLAIYVLFLLPICACLLHPAPTPGMANEPSQSAHLHYGTISLFTSVRLHLLNPSKPKPF